MGSEPFCGIQSDLSSPDRKKAVNIFRVTFDLSVLLLVLICFVIGAWNLKKLKASHGL